MSVLDKIASAIMPPESAEDRAEARRKATSVAQSGGWLAAVLDHHRQIEAAFADALGASDAAARIMRVKRLGVLLTGHANAEESVIYPALTEIDEKANAVEAFEEQAMTKIEMGRLEKLDPMSREWSDKLEHIRGAVLHHVYEEEGEWFPKLQEQLPSNLHSHLTTRFLEEYNRYVGSDANPGA